MKRVLALLLSVMSSTALAQTTGALDPNPAPAQPSVNDDVPPGGCMPIGLTSAGEIVFPIQCKAFIERHRGAAVEPKPVAVEEQKPAAVEEKPATKSSEIKPSEVTQEAKLPEAKQETKLPEATLPETKLPEAKLPEAKPPEAKPPETKQEAKQSEDAAAEDSQPANKPLETVPLPRRGERQRAFSSNDCTHYRTYDRSSGTYRGFDGRMRPCR